MAAVSQTFLVHIVVVVVVVGEVGFTCIGFYVDSIIKISNVQ